jgi:hypothetical protein
VKFASTKKIRNLFRMTFTRIRTVNGHRYLYEEHRWREGGKVKSRSRCLGRIGDGGSAARPKRRVSKSGGLPAFLHAQRLSPEDRALAVAEKEAKRVEQYQREMFGETAQERATRERQEHLDKLYAAYGLKIGPTIPVPIEPQPASVSAEKQEGPAGAEPIAEPSENSELAGGLDNKGDEGGLADH